MAGASITGSVAFAQEETTATAPQTTQPAQNNDGFPWGLLGLAGLAGLAGLSRRDNNQRPERVESIDASRRT